MTKIVEIASNTPVNCKKNQKKIALFVHAEGEKRMAFSTQQKFGAVHKCANLVDLKK